MYTRTYIYVYITYVYIPLLAVCLQQVFPPCNNTALTMQGSGIECNGEHGQFREHPEGSRNSTVGLPGGAAGKSPCKYNQNDLWVFRIADRLTLAQLVLRIIQHSL